MSLKTYIKNQIKQWTDDIATENYVQKEIDILKDILSRINMNEYDIKRLAERTNTTEENVKNIMISMQDKLSIIDDYNEAVDLILDHIDKKNPNINVQKPQTKSVFSVMIDEEDIRGTEQRYNKLKSLKAFQSERQMEYLFTIEMSLKDIPMFNGKTSDDISKYIETYQKDFNEWKKRNKISYVIIPFKNNMNNNISYKQGVCCYYGK